MLITYDTEFLDDGKTIELISIGLVAENGDEFYSVNADADYGRIIDHDLGRDGWMIANVLTKLPHTGVDAQEWRLDHEHPSVQSRAALAHDVEDFLWAHADGPDGPLAELWAYYPATDHVALYQLFGPMIECTKHGMDMRTSCLKQEEVMMQRRAQRNGVTERHLTEVLAGSRPVQDPATEHHALHDARHDMALARWLGLC